MQCQTYINNIVKFVYIPLHLFNYIFCSVFVYRIVPIFSVSAVSGVNLDLILKFLNVIPPLNKDREKLVQGPTEYQVRPAVVAAIT